LLEIGVEPYLLTSGLRVVLNQRLVRRLCSYCRRPVDAVSKLAGRERRDYQSVGCSHCSMTGFRGRMLLAELLIMDDAFRRAILDKSDTATLERATASQNRMTLRSAAEQAIGDGLTSRTEVERVIGPDTFRD
jgi:type II secretory ATPase GspE/PulE/Tfp pilus assembly ATPase PilB-like protein